MNLRSCRILCLPLLLSAGMANAELMIGGYPEIGSNSHPLRQFSANAQGSDAPVRILGGPASALESPANASYEAGEGLLYVSDFYGQTIRVFSAFAEGDVAPVRIMQTPLLGQPRANVPIPALDELIVIAGNCCILTLPLHGSGSNVPPSRMIGWGGNGGITELNNPSSLAWFPTTDEVAVMDYDFGNFATKLVFHARPGNGQATPTRVLKSLHTENAAGFAYSQVQQRIYLLTFTTNGDGSHEGQIRVFSETASGQDAPLYTIEGTATQLGFNASSYQSGIAIDADLNRLMVGVSGNGSAADNRAIVFDLAATGNATPIQVLQGSTLSPGYLGAPFAVPNDKLFADGFD